MKLNIVKEITNLLKKQRGNPKSQALHKVNESDLDIIKMRFDQLVRKIKYNINNNFKKMKDHANIFGNKFVELSKKKRRQD